MATIQSLEMHFLSIINIKNSKIKFEQNCDNVPSKHSYLFKCMDSTSREYTSTKSCLGFKSL